MSSLEIGGLSEGFDMDTCDNNFEATEREEGQRLDTSNKRDIIDYARADSKSKKGRSLKKRLMKRLPFSKTRRRFIHHVDMTDGASSTNETRKARKKSYLRGSKSLEEDKVEVPFYTLSNMMKASKNS